MSSLDKKLLVLAVLIGGMGLTRIITGWDSAMVNAVRIWNGEVEYFPRWMLVLLLSWFVVLVVTGALTIRQVFRDKSGR